MMTSSPAPPSASPGDERGRPERPGPGHGLAELGRGEIEQGPLVPWRRTAHLSDVLIDIECWIVGPVRPPASRRRPAEPLPQPRHRTDPLAEHPPRLTNAEPWRGVEDQDGSDVPRSSAVARSELHQVRGAGSVERRRHRRFTAG